MADAGGRAKTGRQTNYPAWRFADAMARATTAGWCAAMRSVTDAPSTVCGGVGNDVPSTVWKQACVYMCVYMFACNRHVKKNVHMKVFGCSRRER